MGDFYLNLRNRTPGATQTAASALAFFPETQKFIIAEPHFDLVVTRTDNAAVWAPFRSQGGNILVALAGRVALESDEWNAAKVLPGEGGLAAKAIYRRYIESGSEALTTLNGNFTVILYDRTASRIFVVTDRCGAAPAFKINGSTSLAFGSHPDQLAAASGQSHKLDETSLAEFVATGKVTAPFTYYSNVESLQSGSVYTIDLLAKENVVSSTTYFRFTYTPDEKATEWDLAEKLAAAFSASIKRRTHPILGQTTIALSGGLDSRAILACCVEAGANVKAFSFFDKRNTEFKTAEAIANAFGVELTPFQRSFDYYGDSAALALRISGGMGSFVNNHFLGFREAILQLGTSNLLTGFYCDYMFKGLAQNVYKNRVTRTERLSSFSLRTYRPLYWPSTPLVARARERLESTFPVKLREYSKPTDRLNAEALRIFPLAYEPDNVEATVPQRVFPWYLPIVDNDIIGVYLSIPPAAKPNASMYAKMVTQICGSAVTSIPDSNTGAPVNASPIRQCLTLYSKALGSRVKRMVAPDISTAGSWPDWNYYAANSGLLKELWLEDTTLAYPYLESILGYNPFTQPWESWTGERLELLLRLLTLKLWLRTRIII